MDQLRRSTASIDSSVFKFFMSVEHMHRMVLDVMADQIKILEISELNPVQAMLLCSLGEKTVSAGDLKKRGYYNGSNVSYSLNHLVDLGYMESIPSEDDRRVVMVSVTDRGNNVRRRILTSLDRVRGAEGIKSNLLHLSEEIDSKARKFSSTIRYIR